MRRAVDTAHEVVSKGYIGIGKELDLATVGPSMVESTKTALEAGLTLMMDIPLLLSSYT